MDSNEPETVIWLRGIHKQYSNHQVLTDLSMTVYKGTIYALLGASSCGKTTLLSAIVGSRHADRGEIRVLGCRPGERPDNIGYMPQEVALVDECTIKNVLQYFGWLHGMKQMDIDERIQFLCNLLMLPSINSYIKNLSGGQKRRVSLAVALIHNPKVLILDEPTVGVDPELRQQIWNYLREITVNEEKTVVITTHYMEEARHANMIGLMRNGRLLTENAPDTLLEKYNCNNIEDVFLYLSRRQDSDELLEYEKFDLIPREEFCSCENGTYFKWHSHAKALISKNLLKFVRNKGSLAFFVILPAILICLLMTAIGQNPRKALGIVNNELGEFENCQSFAKNNSISIKRMDDSSCHLRGLSCLFLQTLPSELNKHVYYKIKEDARVGVQKGDITLYMEFHSNFSEKFEKFRENFRMTNRDLEEQQINIYEDKTVGNGGMVNGVAVSSSTADGPRAGDLQTSMFMEKSIYETYEKFADSIEKDCGYKARAVHLPIRMYSPVYSTKENTYTEYMAPGFMIAFSYVLTIMYSSMTIITERDDGFWDRTLVTGVTKMEIMIWHFVIIVIITAFQNLVMFIMIFFVFGMHCEGSLYSALALLTFQGFPATAMGMVFSVTSKNVTDCIQITTGVGMALFLLTGSIWPLQAMPPTLRFICYYFVPCTMSVEALANVMHRGWVLLHHNVAKGFYSSAIWCALYIIVNFLVLKYEKR